MTLPDAHETARNAAMYPTAVTGPKPVAPSPEPAAGDDQRSLF